MASQGQRYPAFTGAQGPLMWRSINADGESAEGEALFYTPWDPMDVQVIVKDVMKSNAPLLKFMGIPLCCVYCVCVSRIWKIWEAAQVCWTIGLDTPQRSLATST